MNVIKIALLAFVFQTFQVDASIAPYISFPIEISNALKSGNSKELAMYFNSQIELLLLDKKDVYSKIQAEIVMKSFFDNNKPISFTVLHEGGSNSSAFAIGNLATENGTYRVYCLLRRNSSVMRIHQLRIEREN